MYAITNKRVIIQKGVIGRDFDFIDFDKITEVHVNVGIFDKLFGGTTGTLSIGSPISIVTANSSSAALAPKQLASIEKPYEVYKFFESISYDTKTDIEYPNALRPTDNPGYTTKLASKSVPPGDTPHTQQQS